VRSRYRTRKDGDWRKREEKRSKREGVLVLTKTAEPGMSSVVDDEGKGTDNKHPPSAESCPRAQSSLSRRPSHQSENEGGTHRLQKQPLDGSPLHASHQWVVTIISTRSLSDQPSISRNRARGARQQIGEQPRTRSSGQAISGGLVLSQHPHSPRRGPTTTLDDERPVDALWYVMGC
jgi:hypothetical protein